MGYQIYYGSTYKKIITKERKIPKKPSGLQVLICLCILAMIAVFLINGNGLLRYMIPGDPEITESALESMIANIAEGGSISDAAYAFCREIFQNALSPQ